MRSEKLEAAIVGLTAGPEVPHITEALIHKHLADMRALGLLPEAAKRSAAA
jgi:hypothetical protein